MAVPTIRFDSITPFRSPDAFAHGIRISGGSSHGFLCALQRAPSIVSRLHLPEPEDSVKHDTCHAHHQNRDQPLFHSVCALTVSDVTGNDQAENADVDTPVHRLRHDVVQGAKTGELIEHEWQDRYH